MAPRTMIKQPAIAKVTDMPKCAVRGCETSGAKNIPRKKEVINPPTALPREAKGATVFIQTLTLGINNPKPSAEKNTAPIATVKLVEK